MFYREEGRSLWKEVAWALVLVVAAVALVYGMLVEVQYEWRWEAIWGYRVLISKGWWLTILVSASAIVLTIIVAFVLMLGQRSRIIPLWLLSRGSVEVLRGSPLLVLLLLGHYGFANSLGISSPLPTSIVVLALFEGAYLAEIFRGAWESIAASQIEAARAVGFSRAQTWRYVIFPQALRRALPGTAGQMVSLIKDSSLLSTIALSELTQSVKSTVSSTFSAMEGYLLLAVLYLALTLPLSAWARSLESRYRYET